jgi:hypothetical protein
MRSRKFWSPTFPATGREGERLVVRREVAVPPSPEVPGVNYRSGQSLLWSLCKIPRSTFGGSRDKKLVRLWNGNRVACSLRMVATILELSVITFCVSQRHFRYFSGS